MTERLRVSLEVNGRTYEREVEPRRSLADFLREDLGLKGTHQACEHGFCGNCNVALDGGLIRACLMFAVPLQQAFTDHHGLQCGFCTPAMLLTAREFLREHPGETEERVIREAISGVICRCTGYQQIVEAIQAAARA